MGHRVLSISAGLSLWTAVQYYFQFPWYVVAKILDQTFSAILWFPGRIGPKLRLMLQLKRALTKGLRLRFGGEKACISN